MSSFSQNHFSLMTRDYVSNTYGQLFSLPVIFVLEEVGGGSDPFA